MIASNVGKLNTTSRTQLAAAMSPGACTLPLRCYRAVKLPLVFEPNAMRQNKRATKPPSFKFQKLGLPRPCQIIVSDLLSM